MADADPRDRRRARQDAQPRDRLGRRPARHRHGGRRALRRRRPSVGERIVTPRLADADAAAARGGHAASTRIAPGRGRPAPPTSATARPGARCPTTCRSRPRSSSTTSTPPARTRASSRRPAGTVCVLGAGHAGKLALAAARDAMDGGHRRRGRRRRGGGRAGRASSGSATSASPPTCATRSRALEAVARGRRAAGRPDRRRRQRHRLRADRDPAHRRRGHRPVLLDGDELLDRRADRGRAWRRRARCWSATATPPDLGAYALDLVAAHAGAAGGARAR